MKKSNEELANDFLKSYSAELKEKFNKEFIEFAIFGKPFVHIDKDFHQEIVNFVGKERIIEKFKHLLTEEQLKELE